MTKSFTQIIKDRLEVQPSPLSNAIDNTTSKVRNALEGAAGTVKDYAYAAKTNLKTAKMREGLVRKSKNELKPMVKKEYKKFIKKKQVGGGASPKLKQMSKDMAVSPKLKQMSKDIAVSPELKQLSVDIAKGKK